MAKKNATRSKETAAKGRQATRRLNSIAEATSKARKAAASKAAPKKTAANAAEPVTDVGAPVRWIERGPLTGVVIRYHSIVREQLDRSEFVALVRLARTKFAFAYHQVASETSWLVELPKVRAPFSHWNWQLRDAGVLWLEAAGPLPETGSDLVTGVTEGICLYSYRYGGNGVPPRP